MKLISSIFFVIFFTNYSIGQVPGYIGSLNAFSVEFRLSPSITPFYKVKKDIVIRKIPLVTPNVKVKYSRTLSKHVVVSFGYGYGRSRMYQDGLNRIKTFSYVDQNNNIKTYQESYNYLDDPIIHFQRFSLTIQYYRLGCLAPLGKYIGFGMSYGFSNELSPNIFGRKDALTKDGVMKKKYGILELFDEPLPTSYKGTQFKFFTQIGRSFAVSKSVTINIGACLPLLSFISINSSGSLGNAFKNKSSTFPFGRLNYSFSAIDNVTCDIGINFHF